MKKLLLTLTLLVLTGCTNADKATSVLHKQGYTDIEITGYDFFACSEDDLYATGFEAKSVTGEFISGTVCSGMFKGNTIRLD